MNNFNIISREKNNDIKNRIIKILEKNNFKLNKNNFKFLFIIGGDGTFLHACHKFLAYKKDIIVIGIKKSEIGYFLFFNENNILDLIKKIKAKKYKIVKLPILEVKLNDKYYFAINDISLINAVRSLKLEIFLNDKKIGFFGSSGIIFSTTSGSTAFNKSLGGPIFCSWSKHFILTPVAPINNNKFDRFNNSMVFSKNDNINIKCDFSYTDIGIDGQKVNCKLKKISIKISEKEIKLINLYNKEELFIRHL